MSRHRGHSPRRRRASVRRAHGAIPRTSRSCCRVAARGAYQVGVLAGLAERLPGLEFPILSGMSVGAINTFYLAAHPGPLQDAVAGLREQWDRLTSDEVYRVRPVRLARSMLRWMWQGATGRRRGPAAVQGLADTQPLRAFLTQCIDPRG